MIRAEPDLEKHNVVMDQAAPKVPSEDTLIKDDTLPKADEAILSTGK